MSNPFSGFVEFLNRCGDAYWDFAAAMFIQVSVLVAILLCLDLLVLRRLRAAVRYAAWSLLLVKLILPVSLHSPVSVSQYLPDNVLQYAPGTQLVVRESLNDRNLDLPEAAPLHGPISGEAGPWNVLPSEDWAESFGPALHPGDREWATRRGHPEWAKTPAPPIPVTPNVTANELGDPDAAAKNATLNAATPPGPSLHWSAWVLLGWSSIVVVLTVLMVRRVLHVRRIVARSEAAPDELISELADCVRLAGVRNKRIHLRVCDHLASPAICGFWTATILLPRQLLHKLDREQMRLVLLHELIHWRRCDLQLNLLQTVLQIVYFYNPGVWLGNVILRRSREQAVDEAVLVMLGGPAERYSSTLLDIVTLSRRRTELPLRLLGVVESRKALAGRIRRILARPLPKRARLGITGLFAVLLAGFILLPMARTDEVTVARSDESPVTRADESPGAPTDESSSTRADDPTFAQAGESTVAQADETPSADGDEPAAAPTQPMEYNVLLTQWKLLGPLPKSSQANSGLDDQFVEDEAQLSPEESVTFEETTYEWVDFDKRAVSFGRAFDIYGEDTYHKVGYAWTQFESDAAGPAVLSVGFTDHVLARLNGEVVYRGESNSGGNCILDEILVPVSLRQGTNTLLLKVGQEYGPWETIARILPEGAEKPLFTLKTNRELGWDLSRVPEIDVELLDAAGNVFHSLTTSGYRYRRPPNGLWYVPYGDVSMDRIAQVRVMCRDPLFVEAEKTFAWSEVAGGEAAVPLDAKSKFAAKLVDAETKEPIQDAVAWHKKLDSPVAVGETGVARFDDLSPFEPAIWAGAPGFQWTKVRVDWPWSEEVSVEMEKGGKILRGVVTDTEDKPLAGVDVQISVKNYPSHYETDENGRFEIFGLPEDDTSIHPVITKTRYVAKDRFSQQLAESETDVVWQLELGGIAQGVVTHEGTGEPIAGVTITAGLSRFASNLANPETTTNEQGEYELVGIPLGGMTLHAFSDDYAPAMHEASVGIEEAVEVDFQIGEGRPVTGKVVDPEGNPIGNVWLITDTWNGARMFRRETHSAADGTFKLTHMPGSPAEVNVLKSGYVSKRDLMAKAGEHYDITLAPVVEHRIRIRLADRDEPLPDLEIQRGYLWSGREEISWDKRSTDSRNYDAKTGVFTIRNDEMRSDYVLHWRFRYPGYDDAVYEEPGLGAESQHIDLVLNRASTVRGVVISAETGEPMPGVGVALATKADRLRSFYVQFRHPWRVFEEDFTGRKVTTGPDGSFELAEHAITEDADLVVVSPAGGFQDYPDAKSWVADGSLVLPLAEPGIIQGRITQAGEPLAGELVYIDWLGDGRSGGTNSWDRPFGTGGEVSCDEDGYFHFPAVGAGQYRIARRKSFHRPGGGGLSMHMAGDEIVLLPGQTLSHNIELPAGKTLTGKAVDSQGDPLGESVIVVSMAGERTQRIDAVRADIHGNFTIKHLPVAQISLEATHYCTQDGTVCGLGGEDFRGTASVDMTKESDVVITMADATQSSLTDPGQLTGSLPPDFTGIPLDSDEEFKLSDQWGKIVAIDFWATWCGPCLAVMPEMKALHEKYKDRDDVVFITVSLDSDEEALRKMMKEKGIEFPVLYSGKAWQDSAARAFGVRAIPSSFVIGRDGRFAAEKVHGSQLAATIEGALKLPVDPLYASGDKPGRLTIEIHLKGTELGIPQAKLQLSAIGPDGKMLRTDDINVPGLAPRMVWQYPHADGVKLIVRASADGFSPQQRELDSPGRSETISFLFSAPRTLTGVLQTKDGTKAANLELTATGPEGFSQTATSDDQGRFSMPVVPGSYYYQVKGNGKFAPIPSATSARVFVPTDADSASITIEVCPAVRVAGVVLGADGKPVANAKVITSGNRDGVTTGVDGEFELSGVASVGTSTLYATWEKASGSTQVTADDVAEPITIQIGTMANQAQAGGLRKGAPFPGFALTDLEGHPTDWSPRGRTSRLILLCELAHPSHTRQFSAAQVWAKGRKLPLEIISLDWGLGVVQSLSSTLDTDAPSYWLGPAGLKTLEAGLMIPRPGQAAVVSAEGEILELPKFDATTD